MAKDCIDDDEEDDDDEEEDSIYVVLSLRHSFTHVDTSWVMTK